MSSTLKPPLAETRRGRRRRRKEERAKEVEAIVWFLDLLVGLVQWWSIFIVGENERVWRDIRR